jgi:hypothetical protein
MKHSLAGPVAAFVLALALCAGPATAASAGAGKRLPYTVTPGPARDVAHFRVSYSGSGSWQTTYHSEPPNPGGAHDTNDAKDSSAQRWGVTFLQTLVIPRCGSASRGPDPCGAVRPLHGARGTERAVGRVVHRHLDGLFPAQNASISCRVRAATAPRAPLGSSIRLRYSPAARTIAVTALTAVGDALNVLPAQCPGQGDSIDGLFDNYFTPGFSFALAYSSDRWFKSQTVVIPASLFHRAARIKLRLRETPAGTPPRRCAVREPSFERCTATGSWNGVLMFTAGP